MKSRPFKRLLIANRGEIADRIVRTARRLGLHAIVVYSDADRETLAVERADEAHRLGPAQVAESYLNPDRILQLARATGADAIHPGYGLLSENSGFARRVISSGLVWVGPSPESMEKVSSKSRAKEIAATAGVPALPGYQKPGAKSQSVSEFLSAAEKIGYPVLLKASAGGGGRGIRRVDSAEQLSAQFELARAEARNAFSDDELLLEKFLPEARHIEVQIFGDERGNIVHLGERDCSPQRRNQKVIEEAPSGLAPGLRARITDAAKAIAAAAGYFNAGTVEFLVAPDGAFYFLEVNTRLQVEHTVTEFITGLDLVEWQLAVAQGLALPLRQEQIAFRGHAIQARLYAEDPYEDFRPQTGRIEAFRFPEGSPALRIDQFLTARTEITPYYDSMLAKIIAYSPDTDGSERKKATDHLIWALEETMVVGLETNREYLLSILRSDFFREGKTFTRTLGQLKLERRDLSPESRDRAQAIAALCFWLRARASDLVPGNWSNTSGREHLYALRCSGKRGEFSVQELGDAVSVRAPLKTYLFERPRLRSCSGAQELEYEMDGTKTSLPVVATSAQVCIGESGQIVRVENEIARPARNDETASESLDAVLAPMAGTLMDIRISEGESVRKGQVLAVLEAMKMQMELRSPRDGKIESIVSAVRDQVRARQSLFTLEPIAPPKV